VLSRLAASLSLLLYTCTSIRRVGRARPSQREPYGDQRRGHQGRPHTHHALRHKHAGEVSAGIGAVCRHHDTRPISDMR